jgi:hypothetical protein
MCSPLIIRREDLPVLEAALSAANERGLIRLGSGLRH